MPGRGKSAVIFPGQGSQFAGMGRDLYQNHSEVRQLFQKAEEILGFDLADCCFNGDETQLSQTRITQPAIFVHSVAVYSLLKDKGFVPDLAAGHSLGEYSALVAAGAFTFEEGLSLVSLRGELMQQAGESAPGTMAAVIGLEDSRVEELCRVIEDTVVVANYNSPGQVVVSGSLSGVERLMEEAKNAGARIVKKLKVSGAFHSPLMAYAAGPMQERLAAAKIEKPRIPVVANVTAECETDPERIRRLLVDQITHPVRWSASIRKMITLGVNSFIEAGPGNVLAGLCRRIDRSVEVTSIGKEEQLADFRP